MTVGGCQPVTENLMLQTLLTQAMICGTIKLFVRILIGRN